MTKLYLKISKMNTKLKNMLMYKKSLVLGTREALRFGPICPQVDKFSHDIVFSRSFQNEDCLYLNIYRPHTQVLCFAICVTDKY